MWVLAAIRVRMSKGGVPMKWLWPISGSDGYRWSSQANGALAWSSMDWLDDSSSLEMTWKVQKHVATNRSEEWISWLRHRKGSSASSVLASGRWMAAGVRYGSIHSSLTNEPGGAW